MFCGSSSLWAGLQYVIVVFPDPTHLHFYNIMSVLRYTRKYIISYTLQQHLDMYID